MINRLMISVAAAALIAGTGFAGAQGTHEGPSAGSVAQSAPVSEEHGAAKAAAPAGRDSAKPMAPAPGMKATQSEPAAGKNQRAEDTKTPRAEDGKGQRAEENMQGPKAKGSSAENDNAKAGKDNGKEMKAEDRNGNMSAETKGGADNHAVTTGQAGAGAKLSGEQRTKITTVIRQQNIAPITNINFSISVGTRVPRDVSFHPLPAEIVTIYPDWRGYEFFLVNDRIVVVDPRTFEIVAVLDV
jgi:hypothetical protein